MPSKKPNVEILVHITAPSKSSDDKVYRQLARSYVDFRPKCCKRVRVAQLPKEDADTTVNPGNEGAVNEDDESEHEETSLHKIRATAAPPASSSQEYSTAFQRPLDPLPATPFDSQNLSFRSAVDNLGSPAFNNMTTIELEIPDSQAHGHTYESPGNVPPQSSWVAPASEVGDSYPMADISLLSASPTDLLERYLGRPAVQRVVEERPPPEKTPEKNLRKRANNAVEVPSSQPEQTHRTVTTAPLGLAFIALSADEEFIPDTAPRAVYDDALAYVLSSPVGSNSPRAEPSPRHRADLSPQEDDFQDITHVSNSSIGGDSDIQVPQAFFVPVSPKRKHPVDDIEQEDCTSLQFGGNHTTGLEVQKSPSPSRKRLHTRSDSDSSTVTSKLCKSLSTEIPPDSSPSATTSLEAISSSPPVSIDDIHPDDLIPAKLAKLACDLSTRYKPRSHDPIESLDRGYWFLDCSSFSEDVREKTWTFLARYICSGLAGWGVWCRRAEDRKSVKVFCWGYVVKHVYLLMYLASERALKGVGAVWIGDDGQVKIEVAPTSRQGGRVDDFELMSRVRPE